MSKSCFWRPPLLFLGLHPCLTSISCRQLTRATESCCRQRLTITVINYSGRASELGGTVSLVDHHWPSLSRSGRPPKLIKHFDDRYAVTKFSKSGSGKSSRGKYPYSSRYPNFLITSRRIGRKKPPCQNQARACLSVSIENRLATDRQTQGHSYSARANMASRE